MAADTVLVVDADPETEEKIVSELEAEDYLVFAASAPEVKAGLAGRISPSLIFLKPTSASAEGFQACKAIHNMDAFRNVPIVLLASLKEPMDARYNSFYGVVDFLKMPLNSGDVIKKTEKILGIGQRNIMAPEEESGLSEKYAPQEAPLRFEEAHPPASASDIGSSEHRAAEDSAWAEETGASLEEKAGATDEYASDLEEEEAYGMKEPDEDEAYQDLQESRGTGRGWELKKRALMISGIITVSCIAIVAAGYLAYNFFVAAPAVKVSAPVRPPAPVQQQAPAVFPPQGRQQQGEPLAGAVPEAPKEAAQEKPAAVSEAKAGKPVYSVQIGAFRSEDAANALAKSYKGKGYEAFSQKGTTKDNTAVYRVLIGRYEDRKEAVRLAGKIRAQEKTAAIVVAETGL